MQARGQRSSQSTPNCSQGLDFSLLIDKAFAEKGKGRSSRQGRVGSKGTVQGSPKAGNQQAQLQHQQGAVPVTAGTVRSREPGVEPASATASAAGAEHELQLPAQPLPWLAEAAPAGVPPAPSLAEKLKAMQAQAELAKAAPAGMPPAPSMAEKLRAMQAREQAELAVREAPLAQSPQHHAQEQAVHWTSTQQQHGMEQPVTSTFGRSWPASPRPPHAAATGMPAHHVVSPSTPGAPASAPLPGMPFHAPTPLLSGVSSASPVTPQASRTPLQQAGNQQPGMPGHASTPLHSGVSSASSPSPQPTSIQGQQASRRQPGMPGHMPTPPHSGVSSASSPSPQSPRVQGQQASSQTPGVPGHVPSFSGNTFQPVHPPPGPLRYLPMMPIPPMPIPPMEAEMAMASMPIPPPFEQLQGMLPGAHGHPALYQPHQVYRAYSPSPSMFGPAHPPLAQRPPKPFGGMPPPPNVLQAQALTYLTWLHAQIVRSNHVSSCIMIRKLCEHWKCTQKEALEMMCLDDWYSLPYLKELKEWEESVDNDIACYDRTYAFAATLSDLAQHIQFAEEADEGVVESWLGPLLCHPRVQEIFQPHPLLDQIPKVTRTDCLTALQHLLDRPQRLQIRPQHIVEELMKMHQVQQTNRLCVKIRQEGIAQAIATLNKSGDFQSASFEVQSEDYQKGNTPQAFKDSHKFGVHHRGHRLLPLSQDSPDADATVDATGGNGAPTVRVQCTGQQAASEQPNGRGPTSALAGGRISHTTSPLQQQAADSAPTQPEAAGNTPQTQQQALGSSASAKATTPMAETATEEAERTVSETPAEQVGESRVEVEHGGSDQPGDTTGVVELAAFVKGELRKARAACGGTKANADGLMALVQIERRILSNPQVAKGGFSKLTGGACSSMLDLLSMEPDLAKEVLPSLQMPAAKMEVEGLPAALARQARRTPSVLLLCAVKQAADAWDRAADHTQQTQQQRAKAKEEAVVASLCAQFGVRFVEELGFGSAEQLMADESGDMHSDVVVACALACGVKGAAAHQQPLAVLGVEERRLKDTAVAMLQAAPNFVDLGEWCQWDLAFGSQFGPLASSDILHEAAKHSATSEAASWCALVLPRGHVLKLPHVDEQMQLLEEFEHNVQQLDAGAAVQGMLNLVALKRTCTTTVVQVLKDNVLSALRKVVAKAEGRQDKTMLQQLCSFVLNCLKLLPRPVCPLLAPVFLDIIPEVLGVARADVEGQMLDGAISAEKNGESGCQMQVLMYLGLALGVPAWLNHFKLKTMMRAADKSSKPRAGFDRQAEAQGPESSVARLQEINSGDGFRIRPNAEAQDMFSSVERQDAVPVAPQQAVQTMAEPGAIPVVDIEKAKEHVSTIRRQWGRDGAEVTTPDSRFKDSSVKLAMQALGIKQNTDNSHFMLEVVQNADDNTYTESSVPWVGFEICEDSIHVANNEVGFSKKSMDSICDLCGSEKRADQVKTGNKGIGFKSVFKVTRAAYIQSNAYRVKFDVDADELGYLVPQWLESPINPGLWPECRTHLVLPLQKKLRNSILGVKLQDRLREAFAPKLLVFLKKLEMLTMVDRVKEERIELQRKSAVNGWIEVTKSMYSLASDCHVPISQETASFLMVKEEVQLEPPIIRRDDMAPSKSTSMQLAFQLPLRGSSKDDPERQLVYAYLPMKDYGLRFLLNADFETATNREAIDMGNLYNLKTLGLFPLLIRKAFGKLLDQEFPQGRAFSGLDWWLKCLPRETEVVDMTFSDPIAQLTSSLQRTLCIPTEHGDLVKPSQATVCTDPAVTDLLDQLRRQHPGFVKKHLVHRNCTALYDGDRAKQLQQQLGVHRFSAEQLPGIAREVANHPEILDALGTNWVAKLLQCVFNMPPSLGRMKAIEDMCTLPLLKLSGTGSKYAAAAGVESSELPRLHQLPNISQRPLPLFFPVGHYDTKGELHAQLVEAGGAFAPERLPLPQLDPVLLQQVGGIDSTITAHHLRQRMRDEMGVQEMTAEHVLSLYVLPLFQWHKQQLRQGTQPQPYSLQRQLEDEELIAALRFVVLSKRQLLDEEALKKVRACAVVVAVDSEERSKRCCMSPEAPVYIPWQLGNDIDLASDFPSYNWSMLSVKYAGGHTAGADSCSSSLSISRAQWRDALLELGAHTWLPILQPPPRALAGSELRARAINQSHSRLESAHSGEIPCGAGDASLIKDAECPAFEDLVHTICAVGSVPLRTQQMLKLQRHMADHLQHSQYRNALKTKAHVPFEGAESSRQHNMDGSVTVRTSFALLLHNLPWLLNDELHREVPMVPRNLFTAEFRQFLSNKVDYVHSQTSQELLRFGVNQDPTMELMLDVLKKWAGHETEPDCGNDWFSSVLDMDKVYNFILQKALRGTNATQEYVWNAFKEYPLLWLPFKKDWPEFKIQKLNSSQVMGKFYHIRVARQKDDAYAMEAIDWDKQHIRILGLYYKNVRSRVTGVKCGSLFRTPLYHPDFEAASKNEEAEEEDGYDDDEDGGWAEETPEQQQNTLSEGKRCLVVDYPSTEEYVTALELLQERNPRRSSQADNNFASAIFKGVWEEWLADTTKADKIKGEELREHLHTGRRVFPTPKGWASWQDAIYCNDDEFLAAKNLPVKFLALHDVPNFLEAVWMPSLQRSTAPVGLYRGVPVTQDKEEVTAMCKKALSCMQRVFLRDHIHTYTMLSNMGISQVLPYITVELLENFPIMELALLGPSGPVPTTCTLRQDAALVFGQSTLRLYLKASPGIKFDVSPAARELSRLFSAEAIGQLANGAALRRYPKQNMVWQQRLAEFLKEPDTEKLMQEKGIPQLPDGEASWLDNVDGQGPFANPPPAAEAAASPEDPTNGNKNPSGDGTEAMDQTVPRAGSAISTASDTAAGTSKGPATLATAVVPCSGTAAGELVGVPSVPLAARDANKVVSAKYKQAEVRARMKEKSEERQKKREERLRQQQEGQLQEKPQPLRFSQAGRTGTQVHHYSADEVRRAMPLASVGSRQRGVRGEVMAVQELIKGLSKDFKVRWLDADGSTMKPYDIEVEPAMDEGARAAGAKRSLVEVKSTAKIRGGSVDFKLSPAEFRAALEHGAAYEVFLVRGTLEESPDMIRLPNPAALWKKGQIRMEKDVKFFLNPDLAEEKRL